MLVHKVLYNSLYIYDGNNALFQYNPVLGSIYHILSGPRRSSAIVARLLGVDTVLIDSL